MRDARPDCPCHGKPMWRGGGGWVCAVKERARNAERIRVGGDCVFVGRSHQFRASKQQVKQLINNLRRERHGKSQ